MAGSQARDVSSYWATDWILTQLLLLWTDIENLAVDCPSQARLSISVTFLLLVLVDDWSRDYFICIVSWCKVYGRLIKASWMPLPPCLVLVQCVAGTWMTVVRATPAPTWRRRTFPRDHKIKRYPARKFPWGGLEAHTARVPPGEEIVRKLVTDETCGNKWLRPIPTNTR